MESVQTEQKSQLWKAQHETSSLEELVDLPKLCTLLEKFHSMTRIEVSLLDLDRRVLFSTGGPSVCSIFHLKNQMTFRRCQQDEQEMLKDLEDESGVRIFYCSNGLVDVVAPIVVDGMLLASIVMGQVFLDSPDVDYFLKQARKVGFDESAYLKAIKATPVLTKDTIRQHAEFLVSLAEMVADSGLQKQKQLELQAKWSEEKHRLSELRLLESEEKFRRIFELFSEPMWIIVDDRIVLANQAAADKLGYDSPEEFAGSCPIDFSPPIQSNGWTTEEMLADMRFHLEEFGFYRFEWEHCRKDGFVFTVEVSTTRIPYEGAFALFAIWRDISELREVNRQLKTSNLRLQRAQALARVGDWEMDLRTGLLHWSKQVYRIFGLPPSENVTYERFLMCVHPSEREKLKEVYLNHLKTKAECRLEYRIVLPTGEERYIQEQCDSDFDEEGSAIRTRGTVRDITQDKHYELELKAAREIAVEASEAKSLFLASMSHEIRTPMNGVLGMLDLLDAPELSPEQRRRVAIAQNSAHSLLTILNDILDYSKIEARRLELESSEFHLRRLIEEVAQSFALKASEKSLELVLDVAGIQQCCFYGDPTRIRQILLNLLNNAIKFTESGSVLLSARTCVSEQEDWSVELDIVDTGIGIPSADLERLFEAFTQLDASTTRRFGGTGLGLAISSQLAALMGGSLTAQSNVGKGSTFSVSLPLIASTNQKYIETTQDFAGCRVLVVEDDGLGRKAVVRQLQRWGCEVIEADSSGTALSLLDTSEADSLNLAIVDSELPDFSGESLLDSIRKQSHLDSLALMLMSSLESKGHGEHWEGWMGRFPKPLVPSDLRQVLVKLKESRDLNKPSVAVHHQPVSKEPLALKQHRLLVVEDNPVNQLVIEDMLSSLGYKCDVVENGQEALDRLRVTPSYALILMDCLMPVMDGFETSRRIRAGEAGEEYQDLAIVALTANAMKGDQNACLKAGMNDYLTKPVGLDLLETTLKKWLRGRSGNQSVVSLNDSEAEGVFWDREAFFKRVGHKLSLAERIIAVFQKKAPELHRKIEEAVANADLEEVRFSSHSVKGMAMNLSFPSLQQTALDMEMAARAEDQALVQKLYPSFREQLTRVLALLSEPLSKQD